MKKFKKIRTIKTYKFKHWYWVEQDEVILPSGEKGEYFTTRMEPFVIVLPIDNKGNIYFVKQHRDTINKNSIELPKGRGDGQTPLTAAKRELAEETGLTSGNWRKLGRVYESDGLGDLRGNIFFAGDVKKTANRLNLADEAISEVLKMTLQNYKQALSRGKIFDSPTIAVISIAESLGLLQ